MAYNITKISLTSTIKKLAFFGAVIICLIIINGLSHSIYDLWNKQDLVVKARRELDKQKQQNQDLKALLSYVKSDEFIEAEARNKLFMVMPGESGVIVPDKLIMRREEKKEIILPAWQQWVNLFFP